MRAFYSETLHSGGHELGKISEDYLRGAYDALSDIASAKGLSFNEWVDSFIEDGDLREEIDTEEWVPVTEQLPEDDRDVLISGRTYDEEPIVCIGRYYSHIEAWEADDPSCERVCAWMEKPDSYEEDNGGDLL